jgi:hypothetical protein
MRYPGLENLALQRRPHCAVKRRAVACRERSRSCPSNSATAGKASRCSDTTLTMIGTRGANPANLIVAARRDLATARLPINV